jgi:hypothetical protein
MKAMLTTAVWLGIVLSSIYAFAADSAAAPEATTYQLRNQKYGELLRPQDANSANGTRIVLYPAQPWKCMTWRLQPAGDAFYVQNLFTSKTFAADAAAVVQVPFKKGGAETPAWQFGKLTEDFYKITDAKSGKALTAVKDENDGRLKITVETWRDEDSQKWRLEKIDPKQLTM